MPQHTGLRVFRPHLHAHLHGGVKRPVDAGFESDQIAQMHRLDEVDVVHGRGHDKGARVTVSRHGPGQVDKVHQPPAQQVAQRVRVVGQNDLGHL